MDKSFPPLKGQGLEPHPVVIGAERAGLGAEDDIQISLLLSNFPVLVQDLPRVFRRLIDLAADVKSQQPDVRQFPVGARLDIGVEGDDIAPVGRDLEHLGHAAEGIRKDPVDIHLHPVVSLKRLQKKRKAEAVLLQAAHVPAIGVAQDIRTLPRLFGSGSTAG